MRQRHLLLAAAVAVVLFTACGGGSSDGTGASVTIEVTVSGGEVVGGVDREQVDTGSEVVIVVTADVTDEVHVHGYDHFADVTPDRPARVQFTADIPGIFEVELEGSKTLVLELEVS